VEFALGNNCYIALGRQILLWGVKVTLGEEVTLGNNCYIALGRQILLWGVEVTLLWGGSYSGK